jgi:hypothetical protein
LERLHADTANTSGGLAIEEFAQIQSQLGLERSKTLSGLIHLLVKSRYRRRLLMALFLQLVDQTTGVLVVSN